MEYIKIFGQYFRNTQINLYELGLVFAIIIVFLILVYQLVMLIFWAQNELAKNPFPIYATIVVLSCVFFIYHKQLFDLITNPPAYVYLLGLVYFLLNNLYSSYKIELGAEKVLTQTQITGVQSQIDQLTIDLNNAITDLNEVKTDLNEVKTDLNEVKERVTSLEIAVRAIPDQVTEQVVNRLQEILKPKRFKFLRLYSK